MDQQKQGAKPQELTPAQAFAKGFKEVFDDANQQLKRMGMEPVEMPKLRVPAEPEGECSD